MADRIRNLLFLPLLCFSLCLLWSCESQKSSVANIPAPDEEGSVAKPPSDTRAGGATAQTPTAREQAGKLSEQASQKNPPLITKADLKSEVVNNADTLKVVAEGSGGEGEVTFKYEWMKNGETAGDDSSAFTGFKRGDRISVKVTPYDGRVYGSSRTMTMDVRNTNPVIIEHGETHSASGEFSYQVKATDADGDALSYSLKKAPEGMTIDPTTGLIKWKAPAHLSGEAEVLVSVTDGHGGETFQSFTVETRGGKKRH